MDYSGAESLGAGAVVGGELARGRLELSSTQLRKIGHDKIGPGIVIGNMCVRREGLSFHLVWEGEAKSGRKAE